MEKREINMKELEEKVLMDGKVLPGGVLKVDSFLNHQIDPQILMAMANELKRLYDGYGINKVMTVEASGIAIAIQCRSEILYPREYEYRSLLKGISLQRG